MPRMPEVWDKERLSNDAATSVEHFKESRITEPEQLYVNLFVDFAFKVRHVLDITGDLAELENKMSELVSDGYYDVVRYLTAPPTSEDDMYVIAELSSKSAPSKLALPSNVEKLCSFVSKTLDKKRFVWVGESREATEHERTTSVIATAALMATQRAQTLRRNLAKRNQEGALKRYLVDELGYKEVQTRRISTVIDAPKARQFCGETPVAGKKADVVVGLGDNRFMCVECKVSNSTVNSFKRLNHETVEKATHWYHALGANGVVCAGLLSGVFSVDNLVSAQQEGVSLFWSHDLDSIGDFIKSTYPVTTEMQGT